MLLFLALALFEFILSLAIFIRHVVQITSSVTKFSYLCLPVAYCVVAVESAGRQIPIAFLDRVKEEFTKKYGGGKAATATEKSLNREYG